MKKLITLFLCFIIFASFQIVSAQEQASSENKKSGFYATVYGGPIWIIEPSAWYLDWGVPGRENILLLKGINAGYNLKNKIGIQAGFEYFSGSYSRDRANSKTPTPADPSNYFSSNYYVQYYQFPVFVKTFFSKPERRLRLYLPLGFLYRYQPMEENLFEYSSEGKLINTSSRNLFEKSMFFNIGFGAQYAIKDNISIFAEPWIRGNFWLNTWYVTNRFALIRVDKGINLGINYYFLKK